MLMYGRNEHNTVKQLSMLQFKIHFLKRQILYGIIYIWNLKIKQTTVYNKKDSQIQRTNYQLTTGEREVRRCKI